jgi:ABC-type antimicrobial peptide transport system permease subunit
MSPDVLARLREIAAAVEPGTHLSPEPLRQSVVQEGLSKTINAAMLVRLVGAAALALSMIGTFGLIAYTVEERRREIGIRLALGGGIGQVIGAVLRTALRPSIVGVGLAFLLSAGVATLMRSAVYGLQPFDPLAYLQVAGLLAVATVVAAFVPARRAARVDPAVTLRAE